MTNKKNNPIMAQYMGHAHSEANKSDLKPMQHMKYIEV
jgi:hypothetical protein